MRNKKLLREIACLVLMLTFIIPQLGCQSNGGNYRGYSKTGYYLDTICNVTVYGVDPESELGVELAEMNEEETSQTIMQLITDAFMECNRYEKLLSKTIEGSEISQINDAAGSVVEVSDDTLAVIKKGIEYGDKSGGAFDITIGKATELWDFHDIDESNEGESPLPDSVKLAEAVSHVDYKKIKIDGKAVTLADPEMEIDLGGIAKGFIADKVTEFLENQGVTSAVIDLGGNIVTLGEKSVNLLSGEVSGSFSIGITDPMSDRSQLLGAFPCTDKTVVTSGTYERYLIKDGVKYHHILDVETGYPVDTDVLSVTIIADKGLGADADGLSTTCLALGMEKGLEFIKTIKGVDAVFVDNEGNVEMTSEALGFEMI